MKQRTRKLFIITGISGAGRSQALKCFEDFGFYCVDNLPIAMLDQFAEMLAGRSGLGRVALGIDIREGKFLKDLQAALEVVRAKGFEHRILFLDASDRAIVQRFSETRHRHPLGTNIVEAVRKERRILLDIKAMAHKVIDTSGMTLGELKETLSMALELRGAAEMSLSVVSFGYKFGLPLDADLVMDVRFMPNPNYEPALKGKTGLDRAVEQYLLRQPAANEFLRRFSDMLRFVLPCYIREGKSYLTVAVGCTGGRHRSVFITHSVARELHKDGYTVREFHRDINR